MRYAYIGQNEMGAVALNVLLRFGWIPELVVTRQPKTHANAVEAAVENAGLPNRIRRVASVNAPELTEDLRRRSIDVGLCCGWSELLGPAVLGVPNQGWLNLHPSQLPTWRGSDPIGWQILTGEDAIGCSVHQMTPTLDDGPVVASCTVETPDGVDGLAGRRLAGRELGRLAVGILESLADGGELSGRPQDDRYVTSCPPKGIAVLVDPKAMSTRNLSRAVNAFSPYPGVAVAGLDLGLRVTRARPLADPAVSLTAGTIRGDPRQSGSVEIGCRDGTVVVEVLR